MTKQKFLDRQLKFDIGITKCILSKIENECLLQRQPTIFQRFTFEKQVEEINKKMEEIEKIREERQTVWWRLKRGIFLIGDNEVYRIAEELRVEVYRFYERRKGQIDKREDQGLDTNGGYRSKEVIDEGLAEQITPTKEGKATLRLDLSKGQSSEEWGRVVRDSLLDLTITLRSQ